MSKNSITLSQKWYWDELTEKWFNKIEEVYQNAETLIYLYFYSG